jgi:hypothetical protein
LQLFFVIEEGARSYPEDRATELAIETSEIGILSCKNESELVDGWMCD